MKTIKINTWYELKKFINEELKGDHLGQPVELLIDAQIIQIKEVTLDKTGDITLTGDQIN